MKKIIVIIMLLVFASVFCSCSPDVYFDMKDYDDAFTVDAGIGIHSAEGDSVDNWDKHQNEFGFIPKPNFYVNPPIRMMISGRVIYSFNAVSGTTLSQLKSYMISLENSGYIVKTDENSKEEFMAVVYKSDVPVMECSYNKGDVLIEVLAAE